MVWRNLFRKPNRHDEHDEAETVRGDAQPAPAERTLPAHIAGAIGSRQDEPGIRSGQDPRQRRVAAMKRKRLAILFDIEQAELATAPDNPWTRRIELLSEAMAAVRDELSAAQQVKPGPYHPVPATSITIGTIDAGDTAQVEFAVGDNRFSYSEDPDWAERGHQLARMELVRRTGDIDALLPADTPAELRDELRAHFSDSLFVFASDLRDRALDGEPLPANPTLADLARRCPVCGGWTDWRGTCQVCARRNARIAELKREEGRLLDERASEAEERRRLIEGLPLARRLLRDVEADLASLGEPVE